MEFKLKLDSFVCEKDSLPDEVVKAFEKSAQIYIYRIEITEVDEDPLYGIWLEYGEGNNRSLMFHAHLDELELFAYTLLKSIKMTRRDFKEIIKIRNKEGESI